ncbi:MAG: DUF2240 family protein [Candidatus Thermoplasmatota archaeon]|nr:DUF2240 family protein [Candidatus Thermoplasmatota archaeon]
MESNAKKIISFIFKRSGKSCLDKSEFYLSLSVDLKWFSPDQAKIFMKYVIKKKLLTEKNNFLEPNFDINKILIPFGYTPVVSSYEINDKKNEKKIIDVTSLILTKINYNSGERNKIINNIKNISNEKNIFSSVASLLFFREFNIELFDYIKYAENQIFNE